jgi:hypothetical protein
VLLVPSLVPADGPDLDSENGRRVATDLFAARFGEGSRVYVASGSALWVATAGRVDWTDISEYRRHPLVVPGAIVGAVGLGEALVTGTLAASWYHRIGRDVRVARQTDSPTAFDDAQDDYRGLRPRYERVRWLPLAGVGLVVVGGTLSGIGLAAGPVRVMP